MPQTPPKSRRINDGTGENSTPDGAESNEDPVGAASEQEEHDDRQDNPDEQAIEDDSGGR